MNAMRALEPDVMAEAANHGRQVVAALAAEHDLTPVREQGLRLISERAMGRLLDRRRRGCVLEAAMQALVAADLEDGHGIGCKAVARSRPDACDCWLAEGRAVLARWKAGAP